jgi:hypothetical protein
MFYKKQFVLFTILFFYVTYPQETLGQFPDGLFPHGANIVNSCLDYKGFAITNGGLFITKNWYSYSLYGGIVGFVYPEKLLDAFRLTYKNLPEKTDATIPVNELLLIGFNISDLNLVFYNYTYGYVYYHYEKSIIESCDVLKGQAISKIMAAQISYPIKTNSLDIKPIISLGARSFYSPRRYYLNAKNNEEVSTFPMEKTEYTISLPPLYGAGLLLNFSKIIPSLSPKIAVQINNYPTMIDPRGSDENSNLIMNLGLEINPIKNFGISADFRNISSCEYRFESYWQIPYFSARLSYIINPMSVDNCLQKENRLNLELFIWKFLFNITNYEQSGISFSINAKVPFLIIE